jgi:hypothetical protein
MTPFAHGVWRKGFLRRRSERRNHSLLASRSRDCYAIDWNPHLQQARVRRARSILGVVMQVLLMMMAVTGAKEPPIANRTAIRVLRKQNVTEPIFGAGSSGTGKLFATAIGASGRFGMRSGFVHGKSSAGDTYPTTLAAPIEAEALSRGRQFEEEAANQLPPFKRQRMLPGIGKSCS